MRPAFTIVELLIAIAVLTIGLLALAATAGLVASHVGDGGRLTGAAHVARTVIDSLTSRSCSALTSGSSTRRGVAVEWTVTRDSASAAIEVIVGSELRRGSRRDAYQAVVACARE